jgi:hypothetical protein
MKWLLQEILVKSPLKTQKLETPNFCINCHIKFGFEVSHSGL